MDSQPQKNAKHKVSRTKAKKKKVKVDYRNMDVETKRKLNPKAFTFNSVVGAEKRFRRKQDLLTKKQHIPVVPRTTATEPPPVIVAIVGPPKCGKTTLIASIVKLFNTKKAASIYGPVTIVIGKHKRITIIECNNDINSMIDLAKVADLVYVMCNAKNGFEMEVFEFLAICHVHGMPRIVGVLTHIDTFRQNTKKLRNTVRVLKHRFWTEVYDGAKLFQLRNLTPNGLYFENEIRFLVRYAQIIKFRPLQWRSSHSYVLVDRFEDLTKIEALDNDRKCDRTLALYGYVHGLPLMSHSPIHIAGVGDTKMKSVTAIEDPCPILNAEKKRALNDKEKIVYAPFSDIGGVIYDRDAYYYNIEGSHFESRKTAGAGTVTGTGNELQIGKSLETPGTFQLEESEDVIDFRRMEFERDDESVLDEIGEAADDEDEDEDTDEPLDEDDDGGWDDEKDTFSERLEKKFVETYEPSRNLMRYIYGGGGGGGANDDNSAFVDDNAHKKSNKDDKKTNRMVIDDLLSYVRAQTNETIDNQMESSLFESIRIDNEPIDWTVKENKKKLTDCFVGRHWKDPNEPNNDDDSGSGFSDVEDGFERMSDDDDDDDDDYEDDGDEASDSGVDNDTDNTSSAAAGVNAADNDKTRKEKLLEKKLELRKKFDEEFAQKGDGEDQDYFSQLKEEYKKQASLNQTVFEHLDDTMRVKLEGFRQGMYVRIEIERMSCEFVENFDPRFPVVVGALNVNEDNIGFVNCNIRKNRWYPKILKTNDPVLCSLGWRRFQTIPVYSKLEDDLKFRYLKYTPEHVACNGHFWGPITPQNTGILFYNIPKPDNKNEKPVFSITATGNVRNLDKSASIVKKLKLIGYPEKIFKKTAFINGMFKSELEVARFQGGKIQTVSGIRGVIKKAERSNPPGMFRGTFEDKIKMSDIVFCRTWTKVPIEQFYNPATNLLMPKRDKITWTLARTIREIKIEQNIKTVPNPDHLYTDIRRRPKQFKELKVPKKIAEQLPYRDKYRNRVLDKHDRERFGAKRVAIVREPHEQRTQELLDLVRGAYQDQNNKTYVRKRNLAILHKKKVQKEQEELERKRKVQRKKRFENRGRGSRTKN